MKRNEGGSLYALLGRYYLIFTLVLLAIAGGLYFASNRYTDTAFGDPDVSGLLAARNFAAEKYSDVDAEKYLGSGGRFAVYAENGDMLYSPDADLVLPVGSDELACVPEYNGDKYYDYVNFTAQDGRKEYIVTLSDYSGESESTQVMMLDSTLKVIEGGLGDGRSAYTGRELNFLLGLASSKYEIKRTSFSVDGSARTLVIFIPMLTTEYYDSVTSAAARIWLAAIPLYLAVFCVFIFLLYRSICLPLGRLNGAVEKLGTAAEVRAADCGGPTEIKRLGRSFDELAERLDESERERAKADDSRRELLADISHDIRTPVTVIAGYAGAIRGGKIPPEELARYLEVIETKSAALSELVDTFYEYVRTDHPDFRLTPEKADICEFLREYLAGKYDEIDLAGFSLRVTIPEQAAICRIDAFQLRRALDNILSNSLRHNALGTVIYAGLSLSDGSAHIRIADNGGGIPAAVRKRIFEPFVTGDTARAGGSGLGLSISRNIIAAHGGSIKLVEPADTGYETEFEIILPLADGRSGDLNKN